MSDDAPPRINNASSHSSLLARELVNAAKSDAPPASAKAVARAKFEQFLTAEAHPKPPATDMPLFGSSAVDVLEAAAQGTLPAQENKPTQSSSTAAPAPSNDGFFASSAGATATKPEQHPTGERHENSVLFSLAKLSGSPDSKPAKPAQESKPKSESSVVDVKSMSGSKSAIDEILSVGSGGGLSSPLAAPVLAAVPAASGPASVPAKSAATNKTVVASVLGAATILVGGTLGALYILKSGQPQTQVGSEGSGPNTANALNNGQNNGQNNGNNGNNGNAANTGPSGAQTAGTAANGANGANGANTAGPTGTTQPSGTAPSGNEPSNRAERTSRTSRTSSQSSSTPSNTPSAPSTNPAPNNNTSAPTGNSCAARCRGDIACLLSCGTQRPANNPNPSSSSSSSSAPSGGPEAPGRNDVLSAMRGVQNAVRMCAASTGQTGQANVSVTFASTGRVTTANVAPPFAGTPTGSCIARAVRSATVPSFTRPTFTVNYPFSL